MKKIKKTKIIVEAELATTVQDCIIDCLILSYREDCRVELKHTYKHGESITINQFMLNDLIDEIMKAEA